LKLLPRLAANEDYCKKRRRSLKAQTGGRKRKKRRGRGESRYRLFLSVSKLIASLVEKKKRKGGKISRSRRSEANLPGKGREGKKGMERKRWLPTSAFAFAQPNAYPTSKRRGKGRRERENFSSNTKEEGGRGKGGKKKRSLLLSIPRASSR